MGRQDDEISDREILRLESLLESNREDNHNHRERITELEAKMATHEELLQSTQEMYGKLVMENLATTAKLAKATELLRRIGKVFYSIDPCPEATILQMILKSGLL